MNKTIYSRQSDYLRKELIAIRAKAGLTQRQLADKLQRERSLVGRLELGERRLDMVEFFWLCQACSVDAAVEASRLMGAFGKMQRESAKKIGT